MRNTTPSPKYFGAYEILRKIGDGGMAEIFLAKISGYSGFQKLVALKKIRPIYSDNPKITHILIQEAKLAAALSHFNVAQVYDLGKIDKQVYIAMEYVHGRDLAAILSSHYRQNTKLPTPLNLFIATEFLTGLEYAHRVHDPDGQPLKIVHRDVSPQNILISFEGEVKVTDFGLAWCSHEDDNMLNNSHLYGKLGYISPEQIHGHSADQRSDIFSSGVVLWEILVGKRLFHGSTPDETKDMLLSKEIIAPSRLNPDVPKIIDPICAKALSRNPDYRYQTMGAFLGDLSQATAKLDTRATRRDLSVYLKKLFAHAFNTSAPTKITTQPDISSDTTKVPLGTILLEKGSISSDDLELGLAQQRAQGGLLGEILVDIDAIDETELSHALATQAHLPLLSEQELAKIPPNKSLLSRYPQYLASARRILPLGIEDDACVHLALINPYQRRNLLEAQVMLKANSVSLYITSPDVLDNLIHQWYEPKVKTYIDKPTPPPKAKILLALTDTSIIAKLSKEFKKKHIKFETATDGISAIRLAESSPPTIALVDTALPKIDGFNLLIHLKKHQPCTSIFVLSSARNTDTQLLEQDKTLKLGGIDYINLPQSVEVLTAQVTSRT